MFRVLRSLLPWVFLLPTAVHADRIDRDRLPAAAAVDGTVSPAEPYRAAVEVLERVIEREMVSKELPALSIALVDDQKVVWARGFGYQDPRRKIPATANTVYRVGSVSKMLTSIGLMQWVERGEVDLDAPVERYLPDFRPANPFGRAITPRQLLSHRSGLVREPPVGNYADTKRVSLSATVKSLNRTEILYEPGTRSKYSNAALTTVGYLLERMRHQPFARAMEQSVLRPLGMARSSFDLTPRLRKELARAQMWTYSGRRFDAPSFPLGVAPAGSLYTTVSDLARFMSALFAGGQGAGGTILRRETLDQMWTPQFVPKAGETAYGLGFRIGALEGRRRVGHGGAVYGFATELAALPDEKLGVVVVTSRDLAVGVTARIADLALRGMCAVRANRPPPSSEPTQPVPAERARRLAGHYTSGSSRVDLIHRDDTLLLQVGPSGSSLEVRALGETLITDDRLGYGLPIVPEGDRLRIGATTYERARAPAAAPTPAGWTGLIGEYGKEHARLFIFAREGQLHAMIGGFFLFPLTEIATDRYRFPEAGLLAGETVRFTRNRDGRATRVEAAGMRFERRTKERDLAEVIRYFQRSP